MMSFPKIGFFGSLAISTWFRKKKRNHSRRMNLLNWFTGINSAPPGKRTVELLNPHTDHEHIIHLLEITAPVSEDIFKSFLLLIHRQRMHCKQIFLQL